jgi:hypothetical protein
MCVFRRLRWLVLGAVAGLGCAASGSDDADDAIPVGGKADSFFGYEEGSPEARAILRVANESSQTVLDDDVGLDARAAEGIAGHRPADGYTRLADLALIDFVKQAAFDRMFAFAEDNGLLGHQLDIATFNIRWFGLNGSLFGSFGSETRIETVRAFIEENLLEHDVVVFQEIVDTALFMNEVMPDRTCITYDGFSGKHQHIVLCHTDDYVFEPVDPDGDFALEALRLSNLRPGLHGRLLTDAGAPVADLVGVHLKARPDSTDTRLEQAELLAGHVAALRETSSLPVVVIGDFNTHQARDTGLDLDDEVMFDDLLGGALQRVALPLLNTFRHRDGTDFRLDQAFVSPDVTVVDVTVPGPCNLDFETGADAIDQHFSDVSDHCPVRLRLDLP